MSTQLKVTILANAVIAQLRDPEKEVRHKVSEILSYQIEAAEHSKIGNWDGWSSFYNMKKNTFPAGFIRLVKKRLELEGYLVHLVMRAPPSPTGPERPVVDAFPEDPRYEYQYETMNRLVKMRGLVAQCATGAGKSRIFKLCAVRIGLPTLFLTTRKSLMYQMADDYEAALKTPVGILGDGKWSPRPKGVNFAIVDTITSHLEVITVASEVKKQVELWHARLEKVVQKNLKDRKLPHDNTLMRAMPTVVKEAVKKVREETYTKHQLDHVALEAQVKQRVAEQTARREAMLEFLKGMGFICLEEAHEVSGNGFYQIAQACSNACYRLALTATPFMKDDQEANMRLMAATGPIGIRVTEKQLIDLGILAKPYFKRVKSPKPIKLGQSTAWQQAYKHGIVDNLPRNTAIVEECSRAKLYGLNAMVLVNHKEHGETLQKMLTLAGLKVRYIFGEHKQEERAFCLKLLGEGRIDALIGTSILDVGVDVPSVGLIVLAGAGKAEVNLRQRIGRGLRAKKNGPNVALVVDFEDRFNKHLIKHSAERGRIIESTPGFAENVVAAFDYEKLGFTKV